jgi:hypothetical protein
LNAVARSPPLPQLSVLNGSLAATRKRHAHLLANEARTNIQNGAQNALQNGDLGEQKIQ